MRVNHLLSASVLGMCAATWPVSALALQEATQMESRKVVVGQDGNGAAAATFLTTVIGEDVRYVLVVQNGVVGGTRPAPPVASLRVTLNDEVVFDKQGPFSEERTQVASITDGTSNTMMVAATGTPGSAAAVTVIALRPLPIVVGGRSVLPLAAPSANATVSLVVHNAGLSPMAARLELLNADGSSAGLTPVRTLAGHATLTIDLADAATELGTGWTGGAVHVLWAARGDARASTVARETRWATDNAPGPRVIGIAELALDDYGAFPLNRTDAALFFEH